MNENINSYFSILNVIGLSLLISLICSLICSFVLEKKNKVENNILKAVIGLIAFISLIGSIILIY